MTLHSRDSRAQYADLSAQLLHRCDDLHVASVCRSGGEVQVVHVELLAENAAPEVHGAVNQGLTLVHLSAQRKHLLRETLGSFSGSVKRTAQVELTSGRVSVLAVTIHNPTSLEGGLHGDENRVHLPCWLGLGVVHHQARESSLHHRPQVRGLHSSTFQLNLSALYGIGGVCKGLCSPCSEVVRGCLGCAGCFLVTDKAQVEMRSGRV